MKHSPIAYTRHWYMPTWASFALPSIFAAVRAFSIVRLFNPNVNPVVVLDRHARILGIDRQVIGFAQRGTEVEGVVTIPRWKWPRTAPDC
ncbi:hypothetical protein HMPREF9306_00545 [Propionimicrobium lymphophilum ACS-093-V-SCH5]|uniref:Uncharacterized protein n=1 Tax=Propionimicrobium lymphophilum ACS-093-V-SCH5 TaxID=883161 RepID=S2W1H5_9ACTN|nr:hypothetical protein HMPREF9306_00545 [Propionimicrobium lymphophilum ACS-093-V-SCH5]